MPMRCIRPACRSETAPRLETASPTTFDEHHHARLLSRCLTDLQRGRRVSDVSLRRDDFGDEFRWGVASAAFQVEGAWDVDGKRPSVWDEACRTGRVRGGISSLDAHRRLPSPRRGPRPHRRPRASPPTGSRSTGHGCSATAGARGTTKGGDYYDRLIDGCLARGIEPWVTVHHWDLPLALQREGGWLRRGHRRGLRRLRRGGRPPLRRPGEALDGDERAPVDARATSPSACTPDRPHPMEALAHAPPQPGVRRRRAGACAPRAAGRRAEIGTTNVFTLAHPYDADRPAAPRPAHASKRSLVDAFLDPAAGRGYPFDDSPFLRPLRRYVQRRRRRSAAVRLRLHGRAVLRPGPHAVGCRCSAVCRCPTAAHGRGQRAPRRRACPSSPTACSRSCAATATIRPAGAGRHRVGVRHEGPAGRRAGPRRPAHLVRPHPPRGGAGRPGPRASTVDGFFQWSYADNIEWAARSAPPGSASSTSTTTTTSAASPRTRTGGSSSCWASTARSFAAERRRTDRNSKPGRPGHV